MKLVKTEKPIANPDYDAVRSHLSLLIDICTFNQAEAYVACAEKEYLELISKIAQKTDKEKLNIELFNIIGNDINA